MLDVIECKIRYAEFNRDVQAYQLERSFAYAKRNPDAVRAAFQRVATWFNRTCTIALVKRRSAL